MLAAKQVGKHASIYFIFGIFAYIYFFCFYHLCHNDVGNIDLFTCLSSIGKLAYVRCYESTWNSNKINKKATLKNKKKIKRLCVIRMKSFERIENVGTIQF